MSADLGDAGRRARLLFVGQGDAASAWYRCYLPAMFLGADWAGLEGDWPVRFVTGMVDGKTQAPDWMAYDLVVLQQPRGPRWRKVIERLQSEGTKVVFEIDDYVHAVGKMKDHDFARYYRPEHLRDFELTMGVSDALFVSTDWLGAKYRRFNKRVYVCKNGVDSARYRLTLPKRDHVAIGWAGATGHERAITPWLDAIGAVMERHDHVRFVSIGQPFARESGLLDHFGPHRCLDVPFMLLDQYPAAMTLLDIAVAPSAPGLFFRGKSDLRWIEAGALGIPVVADPRVYPDIEHGVNGFHAASKEEAEEQLELLVTDEKLRLESGANARDLVDTSRDIRHTVESWRSAIYQLLND